MAKMFKDWIKQFLKVFVDDVNIHSQTWEEHLTHLKAILTRLQEVNLKLNLDKYSFGAQKFVYLGYVMSRYGS
jgi:Mg2+ and Co2+ transporter CorA